MATPLSLYHLNSFIHSGKKTSQPACYPLLRIERSTKWISSQNMLSFNDATPPLPAHFFPPLFFFIVYTTTPTTITPGWLALRLLWVRGNAVGSGYSWVESIHHPLLRRSRAYAKVSQIWCLLLLLPLLRLSLSLFFIFIFYPSIHPSISDRSFSIKKDTVAPPPSKLLPDSRIPWHLRRQHIV